MFLACDVKWIILISTYIITIWKVQHDPVFESLKQSLVLNPFKKFENADCLVNLSVRIQWHQMSQRATIRENDRNSQMQKHFSKLFCFNKHSRQVTFEKNWQIESLFPNSEMESDTKAVHLSNGTVNLGAHWHIICHTFLLTFFLQGVQGIHPTLSCYQCEVSSGEPDAVLKSLFF